MLPRGFDSVARARQIVYSYVPYEADDIDAAMIVAMAKKHGCGSICASAQHRATSNLVSHIIILVQIALISAIAANLGYIAAR